MREPQNFHIVLVHGAWHVPEHYQSFLDSLREAGYITHCPRLPTCTTPATATFQDDVSVVSTLVRQLADRSLRVVLLLHSYGGAVGTEAAEGLSWGERTARGLEGGIVHLIYMCAFLLQPGQTIVSASLPRPDPDPVEFLEDGTIFLCVPPRELFYLDVEDELAETSVRLLVHHSSSAFGESFVNHMAWKLIPTTYLKCTEDRVLFPYWQDQQLEAAKDAGADIEVWQYKSSHSPWLSIPSQMLNAVNQIVHKYGLK